MMIYIYNTVTDSILRLNDSIVIDSEKIESLENLHKMELQNNYGKIIINKETLLPEYVDNKIIIAINKNTNNFNKVLEKGIENEDVYYAEVTMKDYSTYSSYNNLYDVTGKSKIAKYFNGQFHLFNYEKFKKYDAKTNSWSTDKDKYKEYLKEKIMGSETIIRHHGFYHEFFADGRVYLQPFRNVDKDNDQTTLMSLLTTVPQQVRKIKLFVEDDVTKTRLTDPKTFYWIMNGQVSDLLLKSLNMLMVGYSESLKSGMLSVVQAVENTEDLEILYDIEEKYVRMVLINMRKAIENDPMNKTLLEQTKEALKKENVKIVKDNNFIGGSTQ